MLTCWSQVYQTSTLLNPMPNCYQASDANDSKTLYQIDALYIFRQEDAYSPWRPSRPAGAEREPRGEAGPVPLEGRHVLEIMGVKTTDSEGDIEAYLGKIHKFPIKPQIRWDICILQIHMGLWPSMPADWSVLWLDCKSMIQLQEHNEPSRLQVYLSVSLKEIETGCAFLQVGRQYACAACFLRHRVSNGCSPPSTSRGASVAETLCRGKAYLRLIKVQAICIFYTIVFWKTSQQPLLAKSIYLHLRSENAGQLCMFRNRSSACLLELRSHYYSSFCTRLLRLAACLT